MNENWIYGQYELDKNALLKYLQSNADSYMLYNDFDESQKQLFGNALRNISTGIKNGTLIGDGFGTFTDNTNTLVDNEMTRQAFSFVHSIANALGAKTPKKKAPVKEIDEEPEKETVVQKPNFDYAKNGLYQDFNKKYNPFGTDSSYGVWKQNFTDQESLNNNLLLHIASHINNVNNGKYNWSNSGIDESSYIHELNYLRDVIKTQGIEAAAPYLKYYGFNPSSFLYELPLPENESEVEPEDADADADAEVVTPVEKLQSQYNNMNALDYVKGVITGNIPADSSDVWRLAGLAADIASIIDAEPFSAAGLGYASDYANYHADEMDGINDSYWDDALNVGLSTLGAIPLLGDLGMLGKISKNIGKYTGILSKLLLIPGIFYGIANADEIKQSVKNVIGGDFTVEDLRNTWTLVQLGLGVKNATKTGKGFKEAVEIDDAAQEALELLVKNNGRKQKLHFTGRHKQELEALQDNPLAFKKYLLDNFEGMDDIELTNITKSSKLDIGWHRPKIVKSEKVNTETKLFSNLKPESRISRARSFRKSTTDPMNIPTAKGKPLTEPEPTVKPESETPTVKPEPEPEISATETPTVETPDVNISRSTSEVEPTKITTEDTEVVTPVDDSSSDVLKLDEPSNAFDLTALSETPSNPSLSAAPNLKSEAMGSVDVTPDIKPSVGAKWQFDDINRILNNSTSNRVEKERLTSLLLSARSKSSRKKARNVYNNKQEGSETYQALRVALGKAEIPDETVRKMLADLNIFRKGGILKAEGGNPAPIVAPDWYKNLYGNRTSLTGWTSNADSSEWVTNENTFHGNADSLDSVFKANQAYTQDQAAVGKDIQGYYKSGESLSDFVTRYNTDAGKIRSFWNTDQTYGGDASLHNPLFRNMFASRSAITGGNANYNLNYLENLLNKVGSSTWHRRMDRYEKDWELLTDDEKRTRLHKINLGNNNYGYVYKKANGDIAELDNSEAEKLLGGKGGSTVITISGGKSEKKTEKLPKPEKPKELFLTTDKLLELWKYYNTLRHNNRQLELTNLLDPLLYDPLEHESVVRGDLSMRNAYYKKAADLMSFNSISTSDLNAYFAQMLEKKNKALEYELQGDLVDNEAIRKSEEESRQQTKENAENRYNIAMKNRENLSQNRKEKLLAQMTKERSDYESDSNINATILSWIKQYDSAKQKRQNLIFSTLLNNWIQDNPAEYIQGWGPYYLSIWDKNNQGLTLTSEELRILQQIQSALANAYLLEVLGEQVAGKQSIDKPAWTPTVNKKGGKVTKKLKDTIIKYLQESNKNYNKAIDRSIKGLYNSIKLERRK